MMKWIFLALMAATAACKPKAKPGETCDGDPSIGSCEFGEADGYSFCEGGKWSKCYEDCNLAPSDPQSRSCDGGTQFCASEGSIEFEQIFYWGECVAAPVCTPGQTEACAGGKQRECRDGHRGVPEWGECL